MKRHFIFLFLYLTGCGTIPKPHHPKVPDKASQVEIGLDVLLDEKLELINGKSIGLVTNHTGIDGNGTPNYERFMALNDVDLKIIFSPEHGLFGEAAAGEKVKYNGQLKSLPKVVSLYGKNRKPTKEQLKDLNIIIYDIQDIGARFYTYISTLGLVMEAAADAGVHVIVLDRPNPITGRHVEGPDLDLKHQSFVGYYPIPIRYGLTVGELAKMIAGEKWIKSIPELTIVPIKNWDRTQWLDETKVAWVKPSPNIPDLETAIIYPGICLLEATNVNEGRGTKKPFKQFGAPWIDGNELSKALNNLNLSGVTFIPTSYIPIDIPGMAINPKHKDLVCNGIQILLTNRDQLNSIEMGIQIIDTIAKLYPDHFEIKESGMERLWGQSGLSTQIKSGMNMNLITQLSDFIQSSSQYHLYE
ncbi:MAG: DUF1343 domain-containing protein [Candidatus Marinimicrobia bacterium]|jgi:uncharacterized protein YbbC (DUF1343 family)|nr:DUF1343 domain-containing protein [Candidatus Neomarinimicrobiota bacterium]MBT3676291.1 DUF1343 domain-containing protein [Candidatus Neomarinimicrobiota bacterium]MBT3762937.1 DUF1343 domain-containing protein [Candidatus Neomarinimicrobiota bacterium]MBT4067209.1 DUF1343 domain-containing protein [Candidatus Neomarinimicrobiota bacterium]MBT4269985.1 DUF1343 domain-containing protein [Candidatus Neomarinimicrobiota bacterium]